MTKAWLKQNMEAVFGYPTVIRFSWKTTDNLLKGAVPVEWVIDEEDEEDGGKVRSSPSRSYGLWHCFRL
jgi:ribonuclease H2 subunit A